MVLVATGLFLLWYLVKEPTMTRAPSVAAVAVFRVGLGARRAAREARARWRNGRRWSLLAGFISTIRWQNAIFAPLPAIEWTITLLPAASARTRRSCSITPPTACLFTIAAVVGFVPQMLVWKPSTWA